MTDTQSSTELLPCPFCGRSEKEFHLFPRKTGFDIYHVIRCYCGAQAEDWDENGAAKVWNTRAEPAEQQDDPVAWRVPISGMYEFFRSKEAALKERADYESDLTPEETAEVRANRDFDPEPLYRRPAAQAVKLDENAEFERWRKEQIASLVRMGYPDAAKAFRELGSVQWAGWQARACLDAVAKLNGIKP